MDELERLKAENQRLKQILKELGYHYQEDINLSRQERLDIFMDYFKGRNDIYPTKYFSKKNQRYEYAFSCSNKFKENVCLITKKKHCSINCPQFSPIPLSKEIYYDHLTKTNSVIGIYPLLQDNTCFFLAFDFDDDLWFENLLSVYRSLKKYQLNGIMERSCSGDGGHLWIFFETNIKASKARKLGDFLLKDAMRSNKHLSFKAFDRLFPNQDYLNGAGLGNLIALPLQHDAVLKLNTVFINELQQPIRKPFQHLYNCPKVSEETVDKIINNNVASLESFIDQETNLLDYSRTLPLDTTIIEDSLIHIKKDKLDTLSLQQIRKIATVTNPKFFDNLRKHLSIYNVSRTLIEYLENDYEIALPRGLKEKLWELVNLDQINYQDKRTTGDDIDVTFNGSLYPKQLEAFNALIKHDVATLLALPGFGKTVLALYLVATIKKSTLIIVNNKELLQQWLDAIDQFLIYPKARLKKDHYIGKYHGNSKCLKYHIDVALIQSLSRMEDKTVLKNYGLVIIDECHHGSSDTYRTVLRYLSAKKIYSLTGTIKRRDHLEKITSMYLGPIAYKVNRKEEIKRRTYKQYLLSRITNFKIIDDSLSFNEVIDEMITNEQRNHLIIQDVIREIKNNKNIIILTDRKNHLALLYDKLKYYNDHVFYLHGDLSVKKRKEIKDKLLQLEGYTLIATSKLLGEGFNLPSLNTMFITMPLSFEERLFQYIGRLHREYQNQEYVKVYDYVDNNIKMLQNMFASRLKTYQKDGYSIMEENNDVVAFNQVVFDKSNYQYYLHDNMAKAKKRIIIFVNECKINRIQKLYSFLTSITVNNIKIYLVVNKNYSQDINDYLNNIVTKVLFAKHHINAIIIDDNQLWSGSSSYLGVQKNDLFYLKTSDKQIIDDLISLI